MRRPLFSFVIPVYNTEKYLRRCIDSVLGQVADNWEIIVVDDASAGNCDEIVKSYGNPKIKYVRHDKNRSLFQARITGVRVAKGEYIVPLDSDDYVLAGLVEELTNASVTASDIIFYKMVLDDGVKKCSAWHNAPAGDDSCRNVLDRLFRRELNWCLCGKAFRRSVYVAAIDGLGCDCNCYINSTEDLCQMVPMLLIGKKVKFIDYCGYVYFKNVESLSKSWMTSKTMAICAGQNKKSIEMCVDFARRHNVGEDMLRSIQDLDLVTIEWLLSLADGASMSLWNSNANILASVYGLQRILKILVSKYPNFLHRFIPSEAVIQATRIYKSKVSCIAVLCDRGFGGGAEVVTKIWARKMSAAGKKIIWLCAPEYESEMCDLVGQLGISIVPLKSMSGTQRFIELEDVCRRNAVDTVLLVDHWKQQMLYDLVWIKSLGIRTVVAEHSMFFFPLDNCDLPLFVCRRNAYLLADAITALSPVNVAWWVASGIKNVVYMPNFLAGTLKCGGEINITAEDRFLKRDLLYIGKVSERKGAKQALEAFNELMRLDFEGKASCRLIFLGRYEEDSYRKALNDEVMRMGLADSVVFAGEVKDVHAYLKHAFILIGCSRIEGSPVTFIEAKSHGVPIVAFSLPFVDGMDEESGVLTVAQGDVCAMASAIHSCMANKERFCNLSRAAISSLSKYSDENTTARWSRLWDEIENGNTIDHGCDMPSSEIVLPMTMTSMLATLNPFLTAGFSSSLSIASLSEEAMSLMQKIQQKVKDKISEYGILRVMRRAFIKLPAIIRSFRDA